MASAIQQQIVRLGRIVFGEPAMADRTERALRFLEEAIELVRAAGLTRDQVVHIVDYEFGRPVETEIIKEFGGAGVTLYAMADAFELQLDTAVDREWFRVYENQDAIREKSKAKPDSVHSTRGIAA